MIGSLEIKLNDRMLLQKDFMSDNPFDLTRLHFYTPSVSFFKWEQNDWNEWYREVGIRAPTSLIFHKTDFFWSFNILLFGFGISVAHQNGY